MSGKGWIVWGAMVAVFAMVVLAKVSAAFQAYAGA